LYSGRRVDRDECVERLMCRMSDGAFESLLHIVMDIFLGSGLSGSSSVFCNACRVLIRPPRTLEQWRDCKY
jgi:hypothetical protein